MTTSGGLDGVVRVIVGVDTHLDEHVAVAIDHHGTSLGEYRLGTTAKGYEDLETWAIGLGQVSTFGVEGTGSYGAGLARHLARCGHKVIEVKRYVARQVFAILREMGRKNLALPAAA